MLKKKYSLFALLLLVTSTILLGWFFAKADLENEGSVVRAITPTATSTQTQKTPTAHIETKTVTLQDSDGDGILDKDDPHPTIPEIYIVEDNDKNGIVDKFEK